MQQHRVSIVYCAMWGYTPRAVSLADELLTRFKPYISELVLVPSDGGKFEVTVGDSLIYSKLETGRHVEPGEVMGLFQSHTGLEPIPEE